MFGNIYKDKKVIVTGNTGFKGSWLTLWLLKLGAKVYGISKDIPTNPSMFEELSISDNIQFYKEDIRNLDAIKEIFSKVKPDFIFHLAAQPIVSMSYSDPIETLSTNVMGTTNILEALRLLNHTCYCIVITSDKCYDNVEWEWGYKETDKLGGKDIYSGSKGAAEIVVHSYYYSFFSKESSNVKIVTARAGNVIGGGDWALDRIVPDCMQAWSKNEIVEIRSPKATRPWQHVLEPLSGYLNLGQELVENKDLHGESFNFGPRSEYSHTVEDLLKDLHKCWKDTGSDKAYEITDNIEFHEAGLLKLNCDKALFYMKWMSTLGYNDLINYTGDWYYNFYMNKNIVDMYQYTLSQISDYEKKAKQKLLLWTQ